MVNIESFKRIAGSGPQHISRLHNRKGERLPARQWLAAAAAAFSRLVRADSGGPWMVPSAVNRLDMLLTSDMTLLELGSGSSTEWYGQRVNHVVSIEPDLQWFRRVTERLSTRGNVTLLNESISQSLPGLLTRQYFDVAIIDHNEFGDQNRPDALRQVAQMEPRIIVLDDSDREEYQEVIHEMIDWSQETFNGMRPNPLRVSETTIFTRL